MEGYCVSCTNGSCNSEYAGRSFLTRKEKIEMLEKYQEDLENEAQGIKERIAELKKQE